MSWPYQEILYVCKSDAYCFTLSDQMYLSPMRWIVIFIIKPFTRENFVLVRCFPKKTPNLEYTINQGNTSNVLQCLCSYELLTSMLFRDMRLRATA